MNASTPLRRRQLASDRRAGSWARAKARRQQRSYLARHWRRLAVGVALVAVPFVCVLHFVREGFLRGLLVGSAATGALAVISYFVVQNTGTGSTMMGDLGEQLTAGELRRSLPR
jgi:hypothetical protein